MNRLPYLLITIGLLIALPVQSNQLIEGFSKWQASRIERIVIDQTIESIADESYVRRYFTQTSQAIEFYDTVSGQRLIPLMQIHIKDDINQFDKVTLCLKREIKESLDTKDIGRLDSLIKKAKELVSNDSKLTVRAFLSSDVCSTTKTGRSQLINNRFISSKLKNIDFSKLKFTHKDTPHEKDLELIKQLLKLIEQIEQSVQSIGDDSLSYLAKAHQMLQIIDLLGKAATDLLDFKGYNPANLNKLKSITLFLAELADVRDDQENGADRVVAILNQYVDEQDTYNRKRHNTSYLGWIRKNDYTSETYEPKNYSTSCRRFALFPCRDTLFLSSYYGLSIMEIDELGGNDKDITGRAYGPVGVELKIFNYRGSPITLGYAPIDIGNYITAELKGESYNAKTEDILAPSVFVSWSAASRPFSILVGYQKDIKIDNGLTEDSVFLSFAFDLPIATIY